MNNGDYDDNILLFERDILLMFTNALSMYHRDLDIHGRAQYMINFAMELFTVRRYDKYFLINKSFLVYGRISYSMEK
jgi:hypothetical protein